MWARNRRDMNTVTSSHTPPKTRERRGTGSPLNWVRRGPPGPDVPRKAPPLAFLGEFRPDPLHRLPPEGVALHLDLRPPPSLVEGVHELHEGHGPPAFPPDRLVERHRAAREDRRVVVHVLRLAVHPEVPRVVPGGRLGRHRGQEDLVALELEDRPREEDELPRGHEVHGPILPDLVHVELRELDEVDLPGVRGALEDELERGDDALLEGIPHGDVVALVDLAQHPEVPVDPGPRLLLADDGLVEEEVVEDGLVRLLHAGIASVGFSSSMSARFTRMMISLIEVGVIVTPTMWSASFRVTLRRLICMNWAAWLFLWIIRATFSALTASRFWSISSRR